MRLHLLIAAAVMGAATATAQPFPARPSQPAPVATAPIEQRETWCAEYAAWVIMQTPADEALPPDVRPTQRFETEMDSCKLDPREYERVTLAEVAAVNVAARTNPSPSS